VKDGQKQVLLLEKSPKKVSSNETLWILSGEGDSQKMQMLVNTAKHEMKVSDLTSEPIRVTEFVKVPKNASSANAFQPSDAMLKEKHTPITLKKGGNKVQIKQEKGWLDVFQNIEISW
jgi:hypothetical protein